MRPSIGICVLLLGVCLGVTPIHAQDATWLAMPGDGNFNNAANWDPATVPTGTAFFGISNIADLTFSVDTTVGGWTFDPGAPAYSFTNDRVLTFNGAGIAINGGSAAITNNGGLQFLNGSSAGSAEIANMAGANLVFANSSSAGNASITNKGAATTLFSDSSSAGNATIVNEANGTIAFAQNSDGGLAKIINEGTVDFRGADRSIKVGSLAGGGRFLLGNTLTVGGNNLSTEVSGVISSGRSRPPATALIKTGTGTLTLSGVNTYQGTTAILDGALIVNGSIANSAVIVDGGSLGGRGTVGSISVNRGGTLAPGNSIGVLRVLRGVRFGPGSTYQVEVNAAGQSDRIISAHPVQIDGGTLEVLAQSGNYRSSTKYDILDANAVLGPGFDAVTTNLAFLVPSLERTSRNIFLILTRADDLSFCSVASAESSCEVANALEVFPTDNELFLAILNQSAEGAQAAFDALSGEVHASVSGVLVDESRYVRDAILGRLTQATYMGRADQVAALGAGGPQVALLDSRAMTLGSDEPMTVGSDDKSLAPAPSLAFWTSAFGAWGDFDGNNNAASADRNLGGFVSGMDARIAGSWRAGLATGGSWSDISVDARHSGAEVDGFHLAGYAGGTAGPLALRGGGAWSWNGIDTSRAVIFPGFFERQKASYDADTGQIFGEIAYPTSVGAIALEPLAGIAGVMIDTDSFKEHGGELSALHGRSTDEDVGYSTVGVRLGTIWHWRQTIVVPHASAAWQHAFNDLTPEASLAFASTGIAFTVTGVPLAQDSALIDAGLDFALGPAVTLGVSYAGQLASDLIDNAVKGRFTWLF